MRFGRYTLASTLLCDEKPVPPAVSLITSFLRSVLPVIGHFMVGVTRVLTHDSKITSPDLAVW